MAPLKEASGPRFLFFSSILLQYIRRVAFLKNCSTNLYPNGFQWEGQSNPKTLFHGCSVDGIQAATGATLGNKMFFIEDRGDMSLVLTEVKSGKKEEARLTPEAVEKGKQFDAFSNRAQKCKAGSPEHLELAKKINVILDWFLTTPDSEVVTVRVLE